MDVPRAAEPLLALPPSRFKAQRDALSKALAEQGDPAATTVRKLRRPVGLAWVLNRLARERPQEVEALVAAGDRLRSGQRRALSGAGAEQLRAADDELRRRARALRSEAERILEAEGHASAPALARLELLLRVTAPLPGAARDALSRGVLLSEPEIASGELSGFAVLPGGREGARVGADRRPSRRGPPGRESAGEKRRKAEARAARVREERERRARARLIERTRRKAEAASARAARAERAAGTAAERSRRATEHAAKARAEAERITARLRELEGRP